MRFKVLNAFAAAAFFAVPASAESWNRVEILGLLGGNGVYGVDVLGLGIYHPRYGLGVGTRALELRGETWDLPRKGGLGDASAHAILLFAPLEARVVLHSWEGSPFTTLVSAESSIGRLEAFGSYCPWAYFAQQTEVRPGLLGTPERAPVDGFVKATSWDWGLSYDAGRLWSVSAGRFEFKTREDGVYRSRRDGRWYVMARAYFGRTHGGTIGATPLNLLRDARFKLCRLVGGCTVVR